MQQDVAFQFFLLSGFFYLATILIALAVSFSYTSVFLRRYMWPSQLLITFQLVYTYYYFLGQRRLISQIAQFLPVYALLLGGAIFYKVWKMQTSFPSRILTYLPKMNAQYPVFVERADYFLPIWFHNNGLTYSFYWTGKQRT